MIWESFEKIMEFSIYTKIFERKISFIIHSSFPSMGGVILFASAKKAEYSVSRSTSLTF